MQVEINFELTEDSLFGTSHNYELSCAILKVIEQYNDSLATKLHDGAFKGKVKLYTFSLPNSIEKPETIDIDGIKLRKFPKNVMIRFGSVLPEVVYNFIEALKSEKDLTVFGQCKSVKWNATLKYKSHKIKTFIPGGTIVDYRPWGWFDTICCDVDINAPIDPTKPKHQLVHDEVMERHLISNLRLKAHRLHGLNPAVYEILMAISRLTDYEINTAPIEIYRLNSPQKGIFTRGTHIKGSWINSHDLILKMVAPEIFHEIAYSCGFGGLNSQGFGLVTPRKGEQDEAA